MFIFVMTWLFKQRFIAIPYQAHRVDKGMAFRFVAMARAKECIYGYGTGLRDLTLSEARFIQVAKQHDMI